MNKFEKYSSYKDSGVEWLGEIPEHWEIKRVKILSRVKRGASPRPIDNPRYFDDNGEFAWVRIADVTANEHYLNYTTQKLSKLGASLSVKLQPNELFLSIAGSVGKPMISNIKCCIHDGFVYFPELKFNKEFLYRVFETGRPYVGLGKTGTQLNLNTDSVGGISIPIPPEDEINAILSFLDNKTAQIDEVISQKEKLIELLKERKQIVINDAVTKGLDKNVEFVDSGVEWIGKIPKHWEIEKVKYIFKDCSIKNYGEEIPLAATQLYGVVPKDTLDYRTVEANVSDLNTFKLVKENNFVISLRSFEGGIEYSAYKGIISPAYTVMEALQDIAFKYFKYLFKSNIFIQALNIYKTGIREGQNISFAKFKDDFLPLPPKNEQIKIAEYIEIQITKIDIAIELQQNYISKLKEYKASLIDSVVTGKVKVS